MTHEVDSEGVVRPTAAEGKPPSVQPVPLEELNGEAYDGSADEEADGGQR
jgi:hypothetical protein